ncbi:oxepin-CoA hydrolase, alternative type [Aquabacterium sp. CECT 9606]|uniref:oxepin-CoA hydrolase, alternative type n=1 Tax=Aquabacterium sp. CECT 9606 TaxID=2845822 RepID=UPI001E5ACF5E|nr:enoyl-CoA hydratase [Aquabacterium sp. CECT 9606]CAH0355001.1 1,2-epoxyphenylacetyl-CoA isomerase [Aquabacterium sp. CECT 9606]
MTTELQTERIGTTQIMTLVGPATRNALSPQVYAAGIEILNVAESNDDVRAVILTGSGEHFCGGGDLQRLTHNRLHDLPKVAEHIEAFHQWIEALRSFPKPVIAAVEGVAAGGGLSLVLACDLVVAAENARFMSAYSQVGLSPDGGASWHLARALGRGPALQLLWQSTPVSAQQMAHWGVVHQVCPAGTVLEEALVWAEQLAQAPAGVLTSIKELVNDAPAQTLRQQLDAEKQHFVVNLLRPEAGQAIEKFLNRKG